jgi:hypothetical protein
MKEKTQKLINGAFFILLFLIILAASLNAPFSNFFIKHSSAWIIFLRFFWFPLFFSAYILFQKLIKKRSWMSLKPDLFFGSLFTLLSVGIFAFFF